MAVFKACQAALRKAVAPETTIPSAPQPSLFELGRNGPDKLEPLASDRSAAGWLAMIPETWKAAMHPDVSNLLQHHSKGLCFTVIGIAMALLIVIARRTFGAWCEWYSRYAWLLGCSVGTIVLLLWFYGVTRRLAGLPGGEQWAWKQGTSIWPTEMMRLLITCCVVTTFIWSWKHYAMSRKNLEKEYCLAPSDLPSEPTEHLVSNSAVALFGAYVKEARKSQRAQRVALATLAYLFIGFGMVFLIEGDLPARPHIRGQSSHALDTSLMFLSVVCFLSLVFYVLDAVIISARLLREISKQDTVWPPALLQKYRQRFQVEDKDLAGYLDVRFAAEKSEETGRLILLPFVIQFLFIISRNSYFDAWTWPGTLVAIFACNILLACAGWIILRRSARTIRKSAIKKLDESLNEVSLNIRNVLQTVHKPTGWRDLWRSFFGESRKAIAAGSGKVSGTAASLKARRSGLLEMQKHVKGEQRGAYSPLFQDPALLAVLIPSGVF